VFCFSGVSYSLLATPSTASRSSDCASTECRNLLVPSAPGPSRSSRSCRRRQRRGMYQPSGLRHLGAWSGAAVFFSVAETAGKEGAGVVWRKTGSGSALCMMVGMKKIRRGVDVCVVWRGYTENDKTKNCGFTTSHPQQAMTTIKGGNDLL